MYSHTSVYNIMYVKEQCRAKAILFLHKKHVLPTYKIFGGHMYCTASLYTYSSTMYMQTSTSGSEVPFHRTRTQKLTYVLPWARELPAHPVTVTAHSNGRKLLETADSPKADRLGQLRLRCWWKKELRVDSDYVGTARKCGGARWCRRTRGGFGCDGRARPVRGGSHWRSAKGGWNCFGRPQDENITITICRILSCIS